MSLLNYLLLVILFFKFEVDCCRRPTFSNSAITVITRVYIHSTPYTVNVKDCFDPDSVLQQLSKNQVQLSQIKSIKCENQNVPILYEESVVDFPALGVIEIIHSGVREIKREPFQNLPSLGILVLSNNEIETVDKNAFTNLINGLRTLDLSNNRITSLDSGIFSSLSELWYLNLNDNRLTQLESNLFSELAQLDVLRVHENKLTCITDKALEDLRSHEIRQITLHGNPWQSDCYNKIKSWANTSSVDTSNN